MQPDYAFEESPKRTFWLIGIVIVVTLGVIVGVLLFLIHKPGASNAPASQIRSPALTIGQYPYVYPCSVATIGNYESTFGLSDGGTVGYRYENSAYRGATGDLTIIAPQPDPSEGYTSSCSLTIPKSPAASDEVSTQVTLTQFGGAKGPIDSLNGDELAASNASANPNARPPTLPSFVTNSVVTVPNTVHSPLEASLTDGNIYLTLDYLLQDGDTTATALPKLDAFAKTIVDLIANKQVATKPSDLTGHATFIGTPFIDVCKNINLEKLTTAIGSIHFRPDSMTSDSQYGALANLPVAGSGVVSSCGLTFDTAADRAGFQAFNKSPNAQALSLQNIYPQSLLLTMNTYASADVAKAAWTAKQNNQKPSGPGPTLTSLSGLGDAAYAYHTQNVFQKSALNQSQGTRQVSYTLLEDDDIILAGTRVITISFQQVEESDPYTTGPLPISRGQMADIYQLFKQLLTIHGAS